MGGTQQLSAVERPTAGVWRLDPGHCDVGFVTRHLGLSRIRGRFMQFGGTVTIGEDPADSVIEVTIDMASITSGDRGRDDHLRSGDFFDVGRFPTGTFRSDLVVVDGPMSMVYGELTLKGATWPLDLEVEYLGHALDTSGSDRIAFTADATINRENWGLTWNRALASGGLLFPREIQLEIDVELVAQPR